MFNSSYNRWFKLRASGLIYTVVEKKYFENAYWCRIRFKYLPKPLTGWIKLSDLRASAYEI